MNKEYVLGVGSIAEERYLLLDEACCRNTQNILNEVDVPVDGTILEIGCGIGTTACYMAEHLVPHGQVVALDSSAEQIELAKALASQHKIQNIEFKVADINTVDFPENSFDLAHTRLVLMYLKNPKDAIRRIFPWIKHGRKFIAEEHGEYFFTNCKIGNEIESTIRWFFELGEREGKDFSYGAHRLYKDIYAAGFRELYCNPVHPITSLENTARAFVLFLNEVKDALIKQKIAKKEEVGRIISIYKDYKPDPDEFVTWIQIMQVIGEKP